MNTVKEKSNYNDIDKCWIIDGYYYASHVWYFLVNKGCIPAMLNKEQAEKLIVETIDHSVKCSLGDSVDDGWLIRKYVNLGIDEYTIVDMLCLIYNGITQEINDHVDKICYDNKHLFYSTVQERPFNIFVYLRKGKNDDNRHYRSPNVPGVL